jgi:hypothetical protein
MFQLLHLIQIRAVPYLITTTGRLPYPVTLLSIDLIYDRNVPA